MSKSNVKAVATHTKTLIKTIEAKNKKVAIARVILDSNERD
ncbi:hypothetical protein FACS1894166_12590 [Bacilli bacterium]|nr:hypothetical protein FACS1894166_12590 [Bacilli bacterium]